MKIILGQVYEIHFYFVAISDSVKFWSLKEIQLHFMILAFVREPENTADYESSVQPGLRIPGDGESNIFTAYYSFTDSSWLSEIQIRAL